ncbi:MAG TPA: hypothetical protein VF572_05225, partial [Candidatus Saccharimonadales bacterium]
MSRKKEASNHRLSVSKKQIQRFSVIVVGLVVVASMAIVGYQSLRPSSAATSAQGPITRQGTKLYLNGQQWKFAGVNADKWFGCWGGSEVPSDAQLDRYFRELNPHSVTRIWPYHGAADIPMMDRIVTYAEKYQQYLAPAMFDGNPNQCGTQVINKGNPQVNIDHMRTIVSRYSKTAPSTQRPTNAIAFWEASNEVCGADSVNWLQRMADAFKSMDPNTLVASGSMPQYCFGSQSAYEAAHGGKMDLISIHEYDANTGISSWGGPAATAARNLNKVWYAGEDGFCCNGGDTGSDSGNASKLDAEWKAYIGAPESAGMIYWALTIASGNVNTHNMDLGDAMWQKASSFRHAYHGGTFTGPGPSPTPTPPSPTPTPTPPPSPPSTSGSVNDSTFQYSGTWATSANAGAYNGDDHYSRTAG